jgi:hypothetical protein
MFVSTESLSPLIAAKTSAWAEELLVGRGDASGCEIGVENVVLHVGLA